MSVALSIVFTGLCALVTDGGRGPSQVLLVDANGVGNVVPEHAPTLVASLGDLANPDTSGPTRVVLGPAPAGARASGAATQIGVWDLTGSEVRVRMPGHSPSSPEVYRPTDGTSSWPSPPRDVDDSRSWRDIRFVPRMALLAEEGRLRPSLILSPDDTPVVLPRGIAGRAVLDVGRVEAGLPTEETYRGQIFEFRGARGEPKLRQAMTDTIRWGLESEDGPIVVEIIPVAGGPVKRLVFAPGATPRHVFVSNLPSENGFGHGPHGHAASDDPIALHFGAYYELLEHEPADRPLPRVGRTVPVERGTGMMRPLICTPVWFEQR